MITDRPAASDARAGPHRDAILFDLDGTLVDESESYREAIRLTASYLLDEPVTGADVEHIKRIPGFNQDWDATWGLIRWQRDGIILVPTATDRGSSEYVRLQDIFQTYYLGADTWQHLSGRVPPFTWNEPLIAREQPLVNRATLHWLRHFLTGIATSRPRAEALLAVRQHRFEAYFPEASIVAAEDAPRGKPDPAPLLQLAHRLGSCRAIYVGDTINDALAARAADMQFVWITNEPAASPETAELAHVTLTSVDELPGVIDTPAGTIR